VSEPYDTPWFRALAELVPSLVLAARGDGRILFSSTEFHAPPSAGAISKLSDLMKHEDATVILERLAEAGDAQPFKMSVTPTGDGRRLFGGGEIVVKPLLDGRPQPFGCVLLRPPSAATSGLTLTDEALSTVSHEMRTPLTAIVGWAQMLRNGMLTHAEQQRAADTILRNAKLQTVLVEDLLDVSRIIAGKLRLRTDAVDVRQWLRTVVDAAKPAAEERQVRLHLRVAEPCGHVLGDRHRLEQVVGNLLSNAIKFSSAGGDVRVEATRRDSSVVIAVEDEGQGMDQGFLPFAFDRFRQADSSPSRQNGGLGLGLAIVREIVERHGGDVRAESEGLGRGSRFTLRLPAAPADVRTMPAADEGPARPLTGCSILVVDDEPDATELMAVALSREGAAVITAGSAASALDVLGRQRVDLIVSDIGMPGMDGYAFIRELRSRGESGGGWTPAVALTGFASATDAREAMLAGYQMHLPKPVDLALLVASTVKLWRRAKKS
jgi:CheY-like chemotaxis protein